MNYCPRCGERDDQTVAHFCYKPPLPRGWQCPVCGEVMAPLSKVCVNGPHPTDGFGGSVRYVTPHKEQR